MIEILKHIALQAGAIAYADQLQLKAGNIHSKSTVLDFVTDTDRKVEKFITAELYKNFPECGVYGEETGKSNADRKLCFIIDPIDGTTSFIHHLPNWCISIGATENGVPVAGVVFQQSMQRLYYAEKGQGAFCNGVRLHVSGREDLKESVVVTGFSCLREQWKEENNLIWVNKIAPLVADLRKYGSAALDCCALAEGCVEAFWELHLQPYDIAAGIVIAAEAGAVITDMKNGEQYPDYGFLAATPKIHPQVLGFFKDYRHLKK